MNPNLVNIPGTKKGVFIGQMKETQVRGEDEKVKKGLYDERLQVINDRIRSYRPNSIRVYKPRNAEESLSQNEDLLLWDGETWDFGEYPEYLRSKGVNFPTNIQTGKKSSKWAALVDAQVFEDFKVLVKSSAVLRGYNHPSRVRGGTYEDVDDFFNFVTIKVCERRLKQYQLDSTCRIWQNWPAYLARTTPQFLILYNKSKFDFDVEAFWPLIKDDKSGKLIPKDFGTDFKLPTDLITKEEFIARFNRAIASIPESIGYVCDILMYLLYGFCFSDKELVSSIAEIVKLQIYELRGEEE